MNTSKKQLFAVLLLLWNTPFLHAQACGCLDCPANIPTNFNTFQLTYQVDGATNDELSSGQCVESVDLQFSHNRIQNLGIELISPAGQVVTLVGNYMPFGGGLSGSTGATWEVAFTQCSSTPSPDPGLLPNWDNLNPAWNVFFGRFTGTYFPPVGNCLENFNTGSVNGIWQLRVTNYDFPPVQAPGILENFSINFCDDTGIAPPTIVQQTQLCEGESVEIEGQVYSETGLYEITLPSSTTCDSILQLDLQVLASDTTFLDTTVCIQERVFIGDQSFAVAGQYEIPFQSESGCDSLVILNLNVEDLEAIIAPPESLTCTSSQVTLNAESSSIGAGVRYIWTTTNGNFLSGENTLSPTVDAAGTYELHVESENTCTATASVTVSDDTAVPQLDLPSQAIITCNQDTYQPELGEAEADVRYTWLDMDGVVVSNAFEPGLFTGTYIVEALNIRNNCLSFASIEVSQFEPPSISIASENLAEDCLEFNFQLEVADAGVPLRYNWTDASGANISTQASLNITAAGTYYVAAFDAQTRCTATDSIVIAANENQAIESASISVQQLDCLENSSGSIRVENVAGGTAPFVYALNEEAYTSRTSFENLAPNTYQVQIEDAQGCQWDTLLRINPLAELQIELGENQQIGLGETLTLEVVSSNPLQNYRWTNSNKDSLACATCPSQELTALESNTYFVAVTDENGCTASDQITISVSRDVPVYMPTAFSPNGDGQNDVYEIYPRTTAVQSIEEVRVYDRWGALVFEQSPDNEAWDGRCREQALPQGVYVVQAKVIYIDGREEVLKESVTLVR